ncbi:MAG: hypothetical protein KDC84_14655 [Crocinitomicaceae bacterium]|nr:hypothetical protein [Crocinitomicaceae bacterium]
MTIQEKQKIIQARLKSTSEILSKYGFYQPDISTEYFDPLQQEHLKVKWTSNNREFNLSFGEKDIHGNVKNLVSLSLIRLPYSDQKDFIGLNILLEKMNLELKDQINEVPHGFEKSTDFYFKRLEELISTSLKNYFKGKSWDTNCWPDWHQ